MTVKEMIELLSKLDPNRQVTVWNCENDSKDPVKGVTAADPDGDVVIY